MKEIESEGVDLGEVDVREVVGLCLRDVRGAKRVRLLHPVISPNHEFWQGEAIQTEEITAQPKEKKIDGTAGKKRKSKTQRVEDKLLKRRKEWEEGGKQGEYIGMNRKERRRLEMEKKGVAPGGKATGTQGEKGVSQGKVQGGKGKRQKKSKSAV